MREVERGFDVLLLECAKEDIARTLRKRHSKMSSKYIHACLKNLEKEYGIVVHFAGDKDNAAYVLKHLLITDYNNKVSLIL